MIPSFRQQRSAFTLVEMVIVGAIVGLVATLALASFAKARRMSNEKALVEDLRILSGAIQTWAQNNGGMPGNGPTGGLPVGMTADDFKGVPWAAVTPLGGHWDFDSGSPCNNCGGAVTVIIATDPTDPTWKEVDALIDDGNLTTGNFRIIRSDRYSYVFEP